MTQDKINIDAQLDAKGVAEGVRDLENLKKIVDSLSGSLERIQAQYKKFSAQVKDYGGTRGFNAQLRNFASGGTDTSLANATLTRRLNLLKSIQDQQTKVFNQQANYLKEEAKLYKSLGLINASSQGTGTLASDKNSLQLQRQVAEIELGKQQLRYINKTTSGVNIAKDISAAEAKLAEIDAAIAAIDAKEKQIAQDKRDQLTYTEKLAALDEKIAINQRVASNVSGDNARAVKASQLNVLRSQLSREELVLANITDKTTKEYEQQAVIVSGLKTKISELQYAETQRVKAVAKTSAEKAQESRVQQQQRLFGDFGASLFKVQGELLINYGIMNQFFKLFTFGTSYVTELDKALHDLQATIAATDGEMVTLNKTVLDVSQGTRFTAVQVAEAAKILGQAGFSAQQINDSLEGVTLLATATGEDLAKATDIASSIISVFNLRAEDMGRVANVTTGAINETKLTVDKLASGIQYAGNIADSLNISFEQTTAILGAMSNAGIKSGSSLGTGLRQVLIELSNPSEKLQAALHKVGLNISDVDVKARGFVPVMKTLRDAGFSTANAFASLDVRAAAAFAAIEKNPEIIDKLTQSFLFSSAASKANETQMKSLSNITDQFANAIGTLVNSLTGNLVDALKLMLKGLTDLFLIANKLGPVLPAIGTALASWGIAKLVPDIIGFVVALARAPAIIRDVAIATTEAGSAMAGLEVIMDVISKNPIITGVFAFGLIGGLGLLNHALDNSQSAIDEIQTSLNEAQGHFDKTGEAIDSVNKSLDRLTTQSAELTKAGTAGQVFTEMVSLENQFGSLGLTIKNKTTTSVYDLIDALKDLRGDLQKTAELQQKTLVTQSGQLLRQRLTKGYGDASALSPYRDNFVSNLDQSLGNLVLSPFVDNNIDSSGKKAFSGFYNKYKTFDTTTATPQAINQITTDAVDVIDKLNADLIEISKAIQKEEAEGNSHLLLDKKQKNLQDALDDVRNTAAAAADYSAKYAQQLSEAFKASPIYTQFNDKITDIKSKISTMVADINDKSNTPEQRAQKEKELNEFVNSSVADLLNLVKNQSKDTIDQLSKDIGRPVTDKDLKNLINGEIKSGITDVTAKSAEQVSNASVETLKKFSVQLARSQQIFDRAQKAYTHVNDILDSEYKKLENLKSENANVYSPLYGKYGDQEIYALGQKQKNLQTAELGNQVKTLPTLIANISDIISQQQKIVDERKTQAKNASNSPEAQQAVISAENDLNSSMEQKLSLEKQLTDATNAYNLAVGDQLEEHQTLMEQLKGIIDSYIKTSAASATWQSSLRADVIGVLDDSKASFKSFVIAVSEGTQTVGSAFKSLIVSILSSIEDKLATKASDSLVGILTSGIGALFGGSTAGTSAAGFSTDISNATFVSGASFNGGGTVKKANSGAYIGRDNQLVMAQAGEGILNRAAMSLIGQNTFNQINALGNRKISQSTSDLSSLASNSSSGGGDVVNVYVVSPDQKPSLTSKDVIVTIADDLSKGGVTKKLVKSIALGQT